MAFCLKCGNQLNEGAKFCGKCGINVGNIQTPTGTTTQTISYTCPTCGKRIPSFNVNEDNDTAFCSSCGEKGQLVNFIPRTGTVVQTGKKNVLLLIAFILGIGMFYPPLFYLISYYSYYSNYGYIPLHMRLSLILYLVSLVPLLLASFFNISSWRTNDKKKIHIAAILYIFSFIVILFSFYKHFFYRY